MAKVKRVGRPRKRGRPKGSKNKKINIIKEALKIYNDPNMMIKNEKLLENLKPITTRLDECMMKFETAIASAIVKLKESI